MRYSDNSMGACASDHVQQHAVSAVRNLPDAHASWQYYWRNVWFRRAIQRFDAALYDIDVERLSESGLELIQQAVGVVLKIIDVHVASLGGAVHDNVDRQFFAKYIIRLKSAADAMEQGLSPSPEKRPTDEQRMDRFADGLRRAGLA